MDRYCRLCRLSFLKLEQIEFRKSLSAESGNPDHDDFDDVEFIPFHARCLKLVNLNTALGIAQILPNSSYNILQMEGRRRKWACEQLHDALQTYCHDHDLNACSELLCMISEYLACEYLTLNSLKLHVLKAPTQTHSLPLRHLQFKETSFEGITYISDITSSSSPSSLSTSKDHPTIETLYVAEDVFGIVRVILGNKHTAPPDICVVEGQWWRTIGVTPEANITVVRKV